jgi:DNA polymerase (family X)
MEVYAQVRLPYIEPELREDTGGRNTLSEMVEAAKARGYEHLAMPNEILKELDLTVCSMHYKLNLPPSNKPRAFFGQWTIRFPASSAIRREDSSSSARHLTLISSESCVPPLSAHASSVNAQPDRLDLSHVHCKLAKELGVKRAISTDAHRTSDRDFMRFGVDQARRGWIEQADVLNSRSLADLKRSLTRQ